MYKGTKKRGKETFRDSEKYSKKVTTVNFLGMIPWQQSQLNSPHLSRERYLYSKINN